MIMSMCDADEVYIYKYQLSDYNLFKTIRLGANILAVA